MKNLLFVCCAFFAINALSSFAITSSKKEDTAVNWSQIMYAEALNGVHVVWTGTELVMINNKKISVPDWFIEPLPSYSVVGILWVANNHSSLLNEVVMDRNLENWHYIKFMLYDLPESLDIFIERYENLKALSLELGQPYIKVVPYFPAKSEDHILDQLQNITNTGNKGLILRNVNSLYQPDKPEITLKLQDWQDEQAQVVGYKKEEDDKIIAALTVQMSDGKIFSITSGLSDTERANPPEIGSIIMYSYNGLTKNGFPRFAKFKKRLTTTKKKR